MSDKPQTHDFPKAIGNPATNALLHAGYSKLEQLTQMTEKEILNLHGVGPKAVVILRETLAEKGLAFAPAADKRKQKGK